jgi:hypothetical protein
MSSGRFPRVNPDTASEHANPPVVARTCSLSVSVQVVAIRDDFLQERFLLPLPATQEWREDRGEGRLLPPTLSSTAWRRGSVRLRLRRIANLQAAGVSRFRHLALISRAADWSRRYSPARQSRNPGDPTTDEHGWTRIRKSPGTSVLIRVHPWLKKLRGLRRFWEILIDYKSAPRERCVILISGKCRQLRVAFANPSRRFFVPCPGAPARSPVV